MNEVLKSLKSSRFCRIPGICLLLLALGFLSGCALRYDVTLNNGMKWTNVTKPVLDKNTGTYVFTDGFGRQVKIKEGRVTLIEPHEESEAASPFRNKSDLPKASSK